MRFFAVEIDATRPASGARVFAKTWGAAPYGAVARQAANASDAVTVRASDSGYRTRSTDAGGLQVYPATVDQAFALDRRANINPDASGVTAGAGQIILANPPGFYDALTGGWVTEGRPVRVFAGQKTYDPARGYFTDPARAELQQVFAGFARQWYLTESTVVLNIRDVTSWLERPLQAQRYGGTGGYDGHAGLANTPKPKCRGGTLANPARNVRPVLIDPVAHVYQCSDAAGGIAKVYEGGNPVFTFQGDTTNLFAGSTTLGNYRTDASRTCFQINPAGGAPAGEITADVWGHFPAAGAVTAADAITRYLIAEDAGLPSANLATETFTGAPYPMALYFAPDDRETVIQALDRALQSFGGRIVDRRDGRLTLFLLRAIPATATPVVTYTRYDAMALSPDPPETPAWRVQVAYQRNHTIQTTGVSAGATDAQRAFVAGRQGGVATWASAAVASAYPQARDIGPIGGGLLLQTDAQAVADALGAWVGCRRRQLWVEVPAENGVARDMGDIARIIWPMDDLASGRLGIVFGERIRAQDGTCRLLVVL